MANDSNQSDKEAQKAVADFNKTGEVRRPKAEDMKWVGVQESGAARKAGGLIENYSKRLQDEIKKQTGE